MKVLVIDIGGTNVKLMASGRPGRLKFRSGLGFTPKQLVKQTLAMTADWAYDAVSIGVPCPVHNGQPVLQPNHLGRGWVGFDFSSQFEKPVKIINDAALQALGSYRHGRMLFLGLGTGLGSALVLPGTVIPLELCELPFSTNKNLEAALGKRALKTRGRSKWETAFLETMNFLKSAFLADEIVIGGGNAKLLNAPLPAGVRLGSNKDALLGGERLWAARETAPQDTSAWFVA